jgi:hypothetical protein
MNSEELAASHKRMESEIFPQSSPVTAPAVAIEKASFCSLAFKFMQLLFN